MILIGQYDSPFVRRGATHLTVMGAWIPMTVFDSSNVVAGGYDASSGTLRLRYVDDAIYDYRTVPRARYDDLLRAPSKGQFVNRRIKPFYRYVRLPRR